MDYLTPQSMAEMESERMRLAQRQQLMQAMMGGNYIPDSGRAGVATSILGSIIGAIGNKRNNEDIRAFMERSFEADNQKAQAEFERKQREDMEKMEREFQDYARRKQKDLELMPMQEAGGGRFTMDPRTGAFTANPMFNQMEMELARGKAGIAAANRAPAADPFADIKAGVAAGVLTPEQAQEAMRRKLMGAGGQNAPSGYRFAGDGGSLEPIPGGPADKPAEGNPKAAAAEQALSVLAQLEGKIDKGEAWTGPIDKLLPGAGQQSFQAAVDALTNPMQTLTRIPGQGAQSDLEFKQLMNQFPSLGNRETVNKESITRLRDYVLRQQKELGVGAQDQGAAPEAGESRVIDGRTFVKINGQWFEQ